MGYFICVLLHEALQMNKFHLSRLVPFKLTGTFSGFCYFASNESVL